MTIKTVLSILDASKFDEDLKNAIEFSRARGAHLTAMVISIGEAGTLANYNSIGGVWIDQRQTEIDDLLEKTNQIKEILIGSDISYDVQQVYTEFVWADEDIAEQALYSDLVLVGRQAVADKDLRRRIIDGALFQTPTPILINPSKTAVSTIVKSVLLAWDSSAEASRAARQALDLLKQAQEVHVTLVDPVALVGVNGEEPGADVATYLARHGVNVRVDCVSSGGRRITDVLRQHAVDAAADLIVMGAYSHPRWQERLFGGVTRNMIEENVMPLFLSH
ncbi:universal stress protein [Rhizobium sp. RAF56]|uniref:universal stress protein n=1 Tax=Rhizobium sp. RAF56 TaxID=3233062 RepID=UPI003F98A7B1